MQYRLARRAIRPPSAARRRSRPIPIAVRWLVVALLLVSTGAAGLCRADERTEMVEATRGMVVSVSRPGSEAGLAILLEGGNAVDAAVATALTLAVTYPPAGNLGGGGFMMIHPPPGAGPVVCIDYRETAPAASHAEMFSLGESVHTHRAVGVPGTVRGLALAHEKFGRLPWPTLVAPAIRLAAEGFELDAALADSLNSILRRSADYAELQRVYGKPEGAWQAGDRLALPELAETLRRLAVEGPEAFYTGAIAEQIVDEMKRGGGLITRADLASYQAKVREPIHGTYRGYDVYGPPPPSSGGICLVQMLNVLEPFELRRRGRWSPETLHLMIEAMRRAYRDRARWLGDSDFVEIPSHLTTKEYAAELAASIEPAQATPSVALADDIPLADEPPSTTHFSVVDRCGMAVSNTYTLEHSYGSRIVVRGAGFLLNNEMGDFNWRPGYTDRRGVIGTPANVIAPGKRMLSSQTPTIIARDGHPVLLTGSPGGRTIINTVLCITLNVLEFEMDLRSAIDAPRLHQGWFPDVVRFEGAMQPAHRATIQRLISWGHDVEQQPYRQGDAHSIFIDPARGRYVGVPDHRIHGHATGY